MYFLKKQPYCWEMNSVFVILVHFSLQSEVLLLVIFRRKQTNIWMCSSPNLTTVKLQLTQ